MTSRALLVSSLRALAATAALLALTSILASCGEAEEDIGPDAPPSTTDSESPSASPIVLSATPVPTTPPGWHTYVDPVVGLSVAYPSDLVFRDLTGPIAPNGQDWRVIEFRSSQDAARAIAISISAIPKGATLKDWAIQFAACLPDTVSETVVGGERAVTCTSDALVPGPAAVIAHGDSFYFISTSKVGDAEFEQFLSTLQT